MKKTIIAAILGTTVALASASAMATTYEIVNSDGGNVIYTADTGIMVTPTPNGENQGVLVSDHKGTVQFKNTSDLAAFKVTQDENGAKFIISDSDAWHGTDCRYANDGVELARDQYIQGTSPVIINCTLGK